jgi:hypothetical protein
MTGALAPERERTDVALSETFARDGRDRPPPALVP